MASTKFKQLSNPLLILSDRPEDTTGLARVARDIAALACTQPQLRVAVLGRGSQGRRMFPWTTYSYPESSGQWGEHFLADACADFFGSDYGIVFSNWDISRLMWLGQPQYLPSDMAKAYGPGRNWDLWGYFPIDGHGISGTRLGMAQSAALQGFNRVLAPSEWGRNVLQASGRPDADWIPHPIFIPPFTPRPNAKKELGWENKIVVGCVAANQARKDMPATFECFSTLKQHYGNRFLAWLHIDTLLNYWNIHALAAEYSVGDQLEVTVGLSDEQLAVRYSGCDCTVLPSAAEGFGYPIAESLACGTACVVTDYAAGQELVESACRVKPVAYRVDTQHLVVRAVLSGHAFAEKCKGQIEAKKADWEYRSEQLADTVAHLSWDKLRHPWSKWLLDGIKGGLCSSL